MKLKESKPLKRSAVPAVNATIERRELERYRTLMNASAIGAWEYYADTGFLSCNDIYFSLLGREIADFDLSGKPNLEQTWINLLHPDDKEQARAEFAEYVKKGEGVYENYFRMLHSEGSWVWIWSRGRMLPSAARDAAPVIIGTHINITRQKKAEEAIQRERILLRTLIDNLPDTIYVKDIDGRKIIANRADVEYIGLYSENEVIGKTDLDLFNNDIGRRGYEDDMRVLRTGEPINNREEYFLDRNGDKRWLQTTKVPVRDEQGRIIRLLGIGHDITLRKKSDEILKKLNDDLYQKSQELGRRAADLKALNQQLEEQKEQELEKAVAQSKFEIASEFLHDIGNAMVGFGSHLNRINRISSQNNLDNIRHLALFLSANQDAIATAIGDKKAAALLAVASGIEHTQSENTAEIQKCVTELLHIITHIQDILNIQRQMVRGHKGLHERKEVNLENILYDCRSMLMGSIGKKGIRFDVNIAAGVYTVKGDHTKLMQVMLNILKNSIEAIDCEAADKTIVANMHKSGNCVEISIADNGQGFDEHTAASLFTRGFTTKKNGTGLGLYNCRAIIESHSGTFDITSAGFGKGAISVIRFAL